MNPRPHILANARVSLTMGKLSLYSRLGLFCWGILWTHKLPAQENYVAFELIRENNWQRLVTEDVDGDGARDLIYSHFQPGLGRELHIHRQQPDGNFESNPQRIEIKTEIIAVGFADLRPEPGKELILLANSAVFSLSTALHGYAGNLKPLLEWDLIADIPNQERVPFFDGIEDLNGDGLADLILPGDEVYGVFLGRENEQFELLHRFSTVNDQLTRAQRSRAETDLDARLSINSEEGVVVELQAQTITPYAGFVEDWGAAERPSRSLLRSDNWMPSALTEELNGDGLKDILYLNVAEDGRGQLNILLQSPSGFPSAPSWSGALETQGDLQLGDVNGDGMMDLLRIDGDGSEWDVFFYLNSGGGFDLSQPAQVMRFSGYDLRLDVFPLEPGEPPLLSVNYYTIPVVEAIRNASINRVQLLYDGAEAGSGQLFRRRPATRLEESFSASNVRGLTEQMSLHHDVDGDGRNDALYVTANGTLAAKRIDPGLQIAPEPFWEYISPRSVFEFEVLPLNNDGSPDLMLRHGTTTTLLVATP